MTINIKDDLANNKLKEAGVKPSPKMPELTDEFIKESVDVIHKEFCDVEDYHLALRIDLMLSIDKDIFHLKELSKDAENETDGVKKAKLESLCDFVLYNIEFKRKIIDELIARENIA